MVDFKHRRCQAFLPEKPHNFKTRGKNPVRFHALHVIFTHGIYPQELNKPRHLVTSDACLSRKNDSEIGHSTIPGIMKHNLILAFAWLTAASVLAADTNSTDKVKEALARLTAATNYSWTTTIKIPGMPFEPGPVKGRTEKGGWSIVSQQLNDNTVEAIFKGEKAAVKSEGEWQSLDKAEGPAAMLGGWLTANGTPADEAGKLLKAVKELKTGDGDSFSGD